mgnify:CR=1 FL=1|jgi:glycosyltransferase involved in cell wall biosynthesis
MAYESISKQIIMTNPLVSIVVPVYNVCEFLPQCMESLVRQSYPNIEIIAVNDGSTDNSLEILDQYAQEFPQVKIISQDNAGLSAARNTGIASSKGEYLCFVDGDDWVDTDACLKAIEAVLKNNVDIVCWNYVKEYRHNSIHVQCIKVNELYEENTVKNLYRRIVGPIKEELGFPQYLDSLSTVWGKLYKSELIKKNSISFVSTKEIGTEDLLFNVEVFSHIRRAYLMTDCLSHYRKYNLTSLTATYKPNLAVQWTNLQNRVLAIIGQDVELRQAYMNRIALSIIGIGLNECISKASIKRKKERINSYLCGKYPNQALKQLHLKYFPIHWKLFFAIAKYHHIWIFMFLLRIIYEIINKK